MPESTSQPVRPGAVRRRIMRQTENVSEADAILVRSAAMHDMEFSGAVCPAIARSGAGVNNIPLDACAEKGIVVFNTPGANANGVKELVLAGMLLASRDVVGGIEWVAFPEGQRMRIWQAGGEREEEICRMRDRGQEAGHHRPGRHRCQGGQCSYASGHGGTGL